MRRGVHHSGGLKAKRRWLAWRRYQRRCEVLSGDWYTYFRGTVPAHTQLTGYVMAYARRSDVGRYAPIGIRDVRP